MRILVHDFSGHPFQAQLSRELASRGHAVVHSYCAAYVGGKGDLRSDPSTGLHVESISDGMSISKTDFKRRLLQELLIGLHLAQQVRRHRPEVVMISTYPVPSLLVFTVLARILRVPWVLWHQDVQGVAIEKFAGEKLPATFVVAARLISWAERWCSRRAAAIVAIADSFLPIHRSWGTAEKVTVIPNWAPLDEIVPVERKNDWAVEHFLDDVKTLLYSGTLGLKHNPALLVELAAELAAQGAPVQLVVVNEGPCVPLLREAAAAAEVPLRVLPFQPYDRLSEVLGSGDVLVVLLEEDASSFSVPSKTLSYLSAGRPILGLMPEANQAAVLVSAAGGCVLPPRSESTREAAGWVADVLADTPRRERLGAASRELAEREFALDRCADKFERILRLAVSERDIHEPA